MVPAAILLIIHQLTGSFKLRYPSDFLADLDRTITTVRLSRYLAAASGDLDRALELYEKNLLLSEQLFGFLHGLEVSVRNSLHDVFSRDLGIVDWYIDGLTLPWSAPTAQRLNMTFSMSKMIGDARRKCGPGATVGKLIAELPFGFWPALIGNRFDDIWRKSLHKGFPNAPVRRQIVHWRLDTIRFLRNRIAHHEPILSSQNVVYTGRPQQPAISLPAILECVHWVSPPMAKWLRLTTRFDQAVLLLDEVAGSGVSL